jgi:hypothetical protein
LRADRRGASIVEVDQDLTLCDDEVTAMAIPSTRLRTLCWLAGLLALSNCATTQETVQDCRKAAYSFCDKAAGAKDAGGPGSGAVDAAARSPAYRQCLETQLNACGPP